MTSSPKYASLMSFLAKVGSLLSHKFGVFPCNSSAGSSTAGLIAEERKGDWVVGFFYLRRVVLVGKLDG